MGAPILGDDMYGNESPLISRHALHALSLEFIHPKTNTPITVCAPPSEDISRVIVELFGSEALSTVINIK
jgi:23S rRNA pseudouridine1911/1915/1917 synthase